MKLVVRTLTLALVESSLVETLTFVLTIFALNVSENNYLRKMKNHSIL